MSKFCCINGTMCLKPLLFAFQFYFILAENRDRIASLVVLPPLVLGYDELYEDVETKTKVSEEKTDNNKGVTEKEDTDVKYNEKAIGKANVGKEGNSGRRNIPETDAPERNKVKEETIESDIRFERNGNTINLSGRIVLPKEMFDCPYHNHKPNSHASKQVKYT